MTILNRYNKRAAFAIVEEDTSSGLGVAFFDPGTDEVPVSETNHLITVPIEPGGLGRLFASLKMHIGNNPEMYGLTKEDL